MAGLRLPHSRNELTDSILDAKNEIMNSELKGIDTRIRQLLNRMIFLGKRTVFKHGALHLYPSEIHLMQVIKEQPGVNAGAMARHLGVSNGAISQTLTRLEGKGVISKAKDASLKNELTATFTETGRTAMRRFEEEQAKAIKAFSSYLASLSKNERKIIENFLSHMEELLTRLG